MIKNNKTLDIGSSWNSTRGWNLWECIQLNSAAFKRLNVAMNNCMVKEFLAMLRNNWRGSRGLCGGWDHSYFYHGTQYKMYSIQKVLINGYLASCDGITWATAWSVNYSMYFSWSCTPLGNSMLFSFLFIYDAINGVFMYICV